MSFHHILIVYNPAAQGGKSRKLLNAYETILQQESLHYTLFETSGKSDSLDIRKVILENTFDLISVVGGDGTINTTINGLPSFDIPLHFIPAGTGNDLIKMIYPTAPMDKILKKPISSQGKQSIDVWRCNEKRFVNGFGAGFDGAIANETQYKTFLFSSKTKYWIAIIKHILFYTSPTLLINGEKKSTFMLSAANGMVYGGGFKVAPDALVNDGYLDLVHCQHINRLKRLYYLPLVIFGKHIGKKAIRIEKLNELKIVSSHPLPAHLDGEPIHEKTYHIFFESKVDVIS